MGPDVQLSCVAMDFLPQDETMKERQDEEYFLGRLEMLEFRFLARAGTTKLWKPKTWAQAVTKTRIAMIV